MDRDGVINRVIIRDNKPFSPKSVDEFFFCDGAKEAVRELRNNGYRVILVTNRPDLARGEITRDQYDRMTELVRSEIKPDDIFVCPHDDHHQCACRKPKPGLLIEASRKWDIDLSASYMIGDTWKDMEAARAAGCKTILIDTVYNKEVSADFRVSSLHEAVSIIVGR